MTKEKFFEALRASKEVFDWRINAQDHIRTDLTKGYCYCPITAVCLIETGERYASSEVGSAASVLDLDAELSDHIIMAADNFQSKEILEFRKELAEVLGIKI